MSQFGYLALETALQRIGSLYSPAQAHGEMFGLVCGGQTGLKSWVTQSLTDQSTKFELDEQDRLFFEDLMAFVLDDLQAGDLGFELMLPDDEQALQLRVEALAVWCQGFVFGFGISYPLQGNRTASLTVQESLQDITAIGQAGYDSDGEDEESAYVDLVEYVRAAVQCVYDECGYSSTKIPKAGQRTLN